MLLRFLDEVQRSRVNAVAQPGRIRTVVEHMPEMSTAAGARHLGAAHSPGIIRRGVDVLLGQRRVEARPAAFGIELGLRTEQLVPATYAEVNAIFFECLLFLRERAFSVIDAT